MVVKREDAVVQHRETNLLRERFTEQTPVQVTKYILSPVGGPTRVGTSGAKCARASSAGTLWTYSLAIEILI
ncbi:hypothetical protein EVAR_80971_1 [Eumeta japonica]|uniref:Uncharacterized protein n=1 Tax=Eumeta variegata TaxID=151549 RepID=A0A4C1WRR6_EUMVA|nr:hypothetical protein EVAR_80971_1 [Eumeta japonica]